MKEVDGRGVKGRHARRKEKDPSPPSKNLFLSSQTPESKMSFSLTFSLTDLKDLNTFLASRSYLVGSVQRENE